MQVGASKLIYTLNDSLKKFKKQRLSFGVFHAAILNISFSSLSFYYTEPKKFFRKTGVTFLNRIKSINYSKKQLNVF